MKIYVDGSGWNGKESKAIVVNEKKIISKIVTSEKRTNNEMEYKALIEALKYVMDNKVKDAIICTDSQLVVGHTTKNWRVKAENLYPLVQHAIKLIEVTNAKIKWIPREENKAGHLLEKFPSVFQIGEEKQRHLEICILNEQLVGLRILEGKDEKKGKILGSIVVDVKELKSKLGGDKLKVKYSTTKFRIKFK